MIAYDLMRKGICNQRQVDKATFCSEVSNVTDPQLFSGLQGWRSLDQIRPLLKRMIRVSGPHVAFGAFNQQFMVAQQLHKAVSAHGDVMGSKVILKDQQQLSGAQLRQSLAYRADQLYNEGFL